MSPAEEHHHHSGAVRVHALSLAFAAAIALALLLPWPDFHLPEVWRFPGGWTVVLPLDKFGHFLLFLAAARPWRRSFRALDWRHAGLATIAGAALYGGLLELGQGALTTTRSPEVLDALAGALGAAASVSVRR